MQEKWHVEKIIQAFSVKFFCHGNSEYWKTIDLHNSLSLALIYNMPTHLGAICFTIQSE